MTNVDKCRLVKVIVTNIYKISDAWANSFGTSWLHNVWEMYLLFIKFKFLWKNGVSEKTKAHLLQHPQHYNNCSAPTFLILFKKLLAPPLFKKEGTDYAFYMRDYKWETIKLLPFYMTDFLFTEL